MGLVTLVEFVVTDLFPPEMVFVFLYVFYVIVIQTLPYVNGYMGSRLLLTHFLEAKAAKLVDTV